MDYRKIIEDAFGTYLSENNLKLHKVEMVKDGSLNFLQVDLDKDGITLDDVTNATRHLNSVFDVKDPIDVNYILDVGTKGAEPVLDNLEEALGKYVKLSFIDGRVEMGTVIKDKGEYLLEKMIKGKVKKTTFHEVDVTEIKVELKVPNN